MSFLSSPRFHLVMSWVWAVLVIPTLLFWKSSILWVAAMSLYANFIGHWSAYQAARAERTAAAARDQNSCPARNAGAEWLPAGLAQPSGLPLRPGCRYQQGGGIDHFDVSVMAATVRVAYLVGGCGLPPAPAIFSLKRTSIDQRPHGQLAG